MSTMPILTIVIPVFNEVGNLASFAPGLIEYCSARHWEIVFVDDGSSDGSGAFLEELNSPPRVRVVHHKTNRGYGRAIKTGICEVTTPYLVTIDADGQHDYREVEPILAFTEAKDADLVVGNRGREGSKSTYRALGKRIIMNFTRLLMPLPVRDLNSGFKLYRTQLARRYQVVCPNSMSFSDVITLVFIHQHDLVLEYPIHVSPRQSGKSTINFYTAAQTVLDILNIILMFNPLKVFLPLSMVFILVGLTWGTIVYMNVGRGLSVSAMLSIVMGLILGVLGLLANQISSMRMERLEQEPHPEKF